MKRILWLWMSVFLLSFCLSFGNQTLGIDLPGFHYEDGIILYGVHSEAELYIPEKTVADISEFFMHFRYAYSELAGTKTTITFLLNGLPITTRPLSEKSGAIRVDFPTDRIPKDAGLTCAMVVTLDYSECDQKPLAKEALWFHVLPETTVFLTGLPVKPSSVADFFPASGVWHPLELSFRELSLETLRSIAQISLLSGYYSKNIKKSLAINAKDTVEVPAVFFEEGSVLKLEGQSLTVGNGAVSLLCSDVLPLLAFRKVENPALESRDNEKKKIALRELGMSEKTIETVYTSESIVGFSIDVFRGVPELAYLSVDISVLHILEDEALTCGIFLNDQPIGSLSFDSKKTSQIAEISIPEDAFRSYNLLRFEMKKSRGNCKSVTVSIHPDSEIQWQSVKPLDGLRIADFPYALYGKTGIVVSSLTEETASLLSKIMYRKGESARMTSLTELTTSEKLESGAAPLTDCDSYLFILDEKDIKAFTNDINTIEGFRIINKGSGKVFFSLETETAFAMCYTWLYNEKPAMLWSARGNPALLTSIGEEQWKRLSDASGNIALINEKGQVVTFLIGEELAMPTLKSADNRLQFLLRGGLITAVALLVILFLVVSYRKTSSKR